MHLQETHRPVERYLKLVDLPPDIAAKAGRAQTYQPHIKTYHQFNRWCLSYLPGGRNGLNKRGVHLVKRFAEARHAMTPTATAMFQRAKKRWRDVPIVLGHNGNVPILPGVLYLQKTRKHIWLKLRRVQWPDMGILRLKFKLQLRLFDLHIRCDIRHFKATMDPREYSALSPVPLNKDGYLTAVCDADGQRLSLAIDALAKIIRDGRLRIEGL